MTKVLSECEIREAMGVGTDAARMDTRVGARFRGAAPAAEQSGYAYGTIGHVAFTVCYLAYLEGHNLWTDEHGMTVQFEKRLTPRTHVG